MPGAEPPGEDVVAAAQPHVVRRHRLGRVLVDQRRQRLDVVAPRTPRRSARGGRDRHRSAAAPDSSGSRRSASSVARARWSALFTDATLVSSSSATSAAFHRSTSHRISTARWRGGRCWSAATKASRIVSRDSATSAGSPSGAMARLGIGSIHVTSGSVFRFEILGSTRGAEVHRPGATLAAVQHVEADVRRDPVEPRAQRGAALEPVDAAPGPDQRVLNGVLGLERRAEHAVAVGGQLAPVLLELTERRGDGGRRSLHDAHGSSPGPKRTALRRTGSV